jgi:LmbE family N-acetylglucosaminyl deacetylase/tetratricopeptide (TPR) repeat protein
MVTTQNHLTYLESAGLVRLVQRQPDLEYLFRHALVQDAAYAVMLLSDRKRLHQAVGETLEQAHQERPEETAAVLGFHFSAAGDDQRAFRYFTLAGEAAARLYANEEAIHHYSRALEISQRSPLCASSEQVGSLYLGRGRAMELSLRYEEALDNYGAMTEVARQRGDRALELASLMAATTIRATNNPVFNPQEAGRLAGDALNLARELNDEAAEARILWNLLLLHIWTGRAPAARDYGEQALALARKLALTDLEAFILHDLWLVYMSTDQNEQARTAGEEGRERLRQLGNLPLLTENLGRSALMHLSFGEFDQAIAFSDEGVRVGRLSNSIEGQSVARSLIGVAYLERGEIDTALTMFREAVALGEVSQNVLAMIGAASELALLYAHLGAFAAASELVHTAQETAEERFPIMLGWAAAVHVEIYLRQGKVAEAATIGLADYQVYKQQFGFVPTVWGRVGLASAHLALAQGQLDEALTLSDKVETDLRQGKLNLFLVEALFLKARILSTQSPPRLTEAFDILMSACEVAELIGSNFKLWQIFAALAQVERQADRHLQASNYEGQARTLIQQIAATIHDPILHTSFLNRPSVRQLIAQPQFGENVMPYRLLAIFAHPDDEGGTSGTLAHYVANGAAVTLACATRGEVGEISDPALATPETLGAVREAELRAACAHLGITDVRFLGYRDSGMVDTPPNDDPRSLHQADPNKVVAQLVGLIREVRPHVIITFDPSGGYGHPDHLAIHRGVVAAVDPAGDPNAFPEAGPSWQTLHLFYDVLPRSFLKQMRDLMEAHGMDTATFDIFDFDEPDLWAEQVTHVLDVSDHVVAKRKAFFSHRTQFGAEHPLLRLPAEAIDRLFSQEYFIQVRPPLPPQSPPLTDLLADLTAAL